MFFGLLASENVGPGSCARKGSKDWVFDFVDQNHVRLSTGNMCLVHGKKKYMNQVSLQPCNKGEFLSLRYAPTNAHENGFFLRASDGSCFDGSSFEPCTNKILWGVGIKYVWGEARRYLFNFEISRRDQCLVARGTQVEMGLCSSSGAVSWAIQDGSLTYNNEKLCLSRTVENKGVLTRCVAQNQEYIQIIVPLVYTSKDLADMVANKVCDSFIFVCVDGLIRNYPDQDKLSSEELNVLENIVQQHSR